MWGQDPLGTEPWGTKTQLPHCLCYISPNVQSKLDPALWRSKGREGCGYTPGSLFFLWDFNCSMNLAKDGDGDSLTLKARTLRHCSLPSSSESLIFVKLHSSCLSDLWRAWAMAMSTCMPLKLDCPPNIREQTRKKSKTCSFLTNSFRKPAFLRPCVTEREWRFHLSLEPVILRLRL